LLSQWRGYAHGGGFAIEFDELEIDKLNEEKRTNWRYEESLTDAVIYFNHEIMLDIHEFEGIAGPFFRSILSVLPAFSKVTDEPDHVLGTHDIRHYSRLFLSTAPFLKHRDFLEEKEYRIVALCYRPRAGEQRDKRRTKPIQFRMREASVLPYIAFIVT
jgi:hypothetical protein